jgi:aminopeptidase N
MVPLMMDDSKPSIWPVSNKDLIGNDQIVDSVSAFIYGKGASLLRLLEHIIGEQRFQSAIHNALSADNQSSLSNAFFLTLNNETILSSDIKPEAFLRSWLEERNYPIVTVDFLPSNSTSPNTTVTFRQSRYLGSVSLNDSSLDRDYTWKIYMECQLGGSSIGDTVNLTSNIELMTEKFIFQSAIQTLEFPNKNYQWIKCNKDFYSYQVTEYVSYSDDQHLLWQYFDLLFREVEHFASHYLLSISDVFV